MTKSMSNNGTAVANLSLSKENMDALVAAGIVKEDYIRLKEGFNSKYDVVHMEMQEIKSFKKGIDKVSMPKYTFRNDSGTIIVWGSTLLGAIVLKNFKIKTDTIGKANKLPIYFRDEFNVEFPNTRKLSDIRNEEGGVDIQSNYSIVGAIVTRSKVDSTRWAIDFKLYEKGILFLEFEKARLGDKTITWISEERLVEISKLKKAERSFTDANGAVVVLPSNDELKIVGNADTDVKYAKATFIIEQNW